MAKLILIDPSLKSISIEEFNGTYDGMKEACGWKECSTDKVGISYQTWMFVRDDGRYTEGSRFSYQGFADVIYGKAAIVAWPSITKDKFIDVSSSVEDIQNLVTWV